MTLFSRVRSCEDLEQTVVHIVRQTLREGIAGSRLARRILTEARRISPNYPFAPIVSQDDFVREIAQGLCAAVVGRMQPRPVRGLAMAETVGNINLGPGDTDAYVHAKCTPIFTRSREANHGQPRCAERQQRTGPAPG